MLIVCPSCASEYTIDGSKLGPDGRKVRCASCRHEWFVHPEIVQDETSIDKLSSRSTRLQREKRPSRFSGWSARMGRRLVSSAAAIMVVASLIGIVQARAAIVSLFPETARLYAAVGLPVNLQGLTFERVTSRLGPQNGEMFLVVEGTIRNITRDPREVPLIEVSIRGHSKQSLYTWTSEPPLSPLGPGEASTFRARLSTPPGDGRDVLVKFASPAVPSKHAAMP